MTFKSPCPPYDPADKNGFSFETVNKRWPVILTKLIDQIHRVNHDLLMLKEMSSGGQNWEAHVEEGTAIIEKVSKLKYEMARDRTLQPLEDDGGPNITSYNEALKELATNGKDTWYSCPWLYAECYLYRLLRTWMAPTTYWKDYDPFLTGKEDSFKASSAAIYQLAETMHELDESKAEIESDPQKLAVLYNEMLQMCLWGNATDLSLLTNLTHEDILKLQTVGKDAQEERRAFILHDDEKASLEHLKSLKDGRIDFVLDNAGFELFTDLVFADFLVTYTPHVSSVVFHPKCMPWFVSDVTPPDFTELLVALEKPDFFLANAPSESAKVQLATLVKRWKNYVDDGTFSLSVARDYPLGKSDVMYDFWTEADPYWYMLERAPELFEFLKKSGLVIFKGDLNYRKLTGDVAWPASTPVQEAFGPLSGEFPILSLRTSKADVIVGVDQAKADALDASGEKWRVNGKYAMISFVPQAYP